MAAAILFIFGVYCIVVGFQGNASDLFGQLVKDLPGFMPWVLGVIILSILAVNDETGKFIKPLLILIFLGILLKDWTKIKTTAIDSYDVITGESQ